MPDAMTTEPGLKWLTAFVELLKTGGPWTLLAIVLIMYWRKDKELRALYLRMIDMSTLQAGLVAKTEMTLAALRETLTGAIDKWREE
jgi:hypothetical protein